MATSAQISGGHAIYTAGRRRSTGFNVRRGGVYHFLTAGHGTNAGASRTRAERAPAPVVGTSLLTNDDGLLATPT